MKWAQKAENQKPRCLRRGEKGQRKGVGGQAGVPLPPDTPFYLAELYQSKYNHRTLEPSQYRSAKMFQ